jgi:hypothetical protein
MKQLNISGRELKPPDYNQLRKDLGIKPATNPFVFLSIGMFILAIIFGTIALGIDMGWWNR